MTRLVNLIEQAFHFPKLKTERPMDKQQLKAVAVKAWQRILREKTSHLSLRRNC